MRTMWWIERFLRGRARARRRRIPFKSITDFPFRFLFWRELSSSWTLDLVSAAKKKQGKKKATHSLLAFFLYFFFQFSKKSLDKFTIIAKDVVVSCDLLFLPSSYRRRRRRRRHVRPSGEPPARRRTGEGRDEEEEEAFFRGWKRLRISWKPLVLSTEEGGVRLRCW